MWHKNQQINQGLITAAAVVPVVEYNWCSELAILWTAVNTLTADSQQTDTQRDRMLCRHCLSTESCLQWLAASWCSYSCTHRLTVVCCCWDDSDVSVNCLLVYICVTVSCTVYTVSQKNTSVLWNVLQLVLVLTCNAWTWRWRSEIQDVDCSDLLRLSLEVITRSWRLLCVFTTTHTHTHTHTHDLVLQETTKHLLFSLLYVIVFYVLVYNAPCAVWALGPRALGETL